MPLFANSIAKALQEQESKHREEIEDLQAQLAAARGMNNPQANPQPAGAAAPPDYVDVMSNPSSNDVDQPTAARDSKDEKQGNIFYPPPDMGPSNGMQYVQPPPMVPVQQQEYANRGFDGQGFNVPVQQLLQQANNNRKKGGCCKKRNKCCGRRC